MFSDAAGRDWSTAITVTTVKRVREMADVLLTDAAETNLIERLTGDVMLLADTLNAVCRPQAEQRQITSEQFGELLAGDVIDRACESLMDDLIRFFPSGRRAIVRRLVTTSREVEAKQMELLKAKLTDEQVAAMIQRQMTTAAEQIDKSLAEFGGTSGSLPASSESTQAR